MSSKNAIRKERVSVYNDKPNNSGHWDSQFQKLLVTLEIHHILKYQFDLQFPLNYIESSYYELDISLLINIIYFLRFLEHEEQKKIF